MYVRFKRPFKHCVLMALHPTTFEPGDYEVDEETANIAIENGYAVELKEVKPEPKPSPKPEAVKKPATFPGGATGTRGKVARGNGGTRSKRSKSNSK